MSTQHTPVLLKEVIEYLQPASGQHFIDGTLGGGGHAKSILAATSPNGNLLGIDADESALTSSKKKLEEFAGRVTYIQDSFAEIKQIYHERFSLHKVNGILLDLGLSSIELESTDRGFSFQIDAPLDMRFDRRQSLTATEIVNTWPSNTLTKIFQEYGQEKLASEITNQIIFQRRKQKIKNTTELVNAILLVYRKKLGSKKEVPWIGGIHPATKVFQALRIAVNDELEQLKKVLPQAIDIHQPGGRLAVISFHSLEDRIVKQYFKKESRDCICPSDMPVCQCQHQASVKIITKKPETPSNKEIEINPRSRSAKLRVAEKI